MVLKLFPLVPMAMFIIGYLVVGNVVLGWTAYQGLVYGLVDIPGGMLAGTVSHRIDFRPVDAIFGPFFYFLLVFVAFTQSLLSYKVVWHIIVALAVVVFGFHDLYIYKNVIQNHEVSIVGKFTHNDEEQKVEQAERDEKPLEQIYNILCTILIQIVYFHPFVYISSHMYQAGCNQGMLLPENDTVYNALLIGSSSLFVGGLFIVWLPPKAMSFFIFINHGVLIGAFVLLWSAPAKVSCDLPRLYGATFAAMFSLSTINYWQIINLHFDMMKYGICAAIGATLAQQIVNAYTTPSVLLYKDYRDTSGMWLVMTILAGAMVPMNTYNVLKPFHCFKKY
jgi:hypothetical protein